MVLARVRPGKKIKDACIIKEKEGPSNSNNALLYIENPKHSTKKLFKSASKFNRTTGYKFNIKVSYISLY